MAPAMKTYRVSLGAGRAFNTTYEGVIPNLERRHKETDSDFIRRDIERFMQERPCYKCHGMRLRPEVLAVTVHGSRLWTSVTCRSMTPSAGSMKYR
jgi:excinuclease ABC subunit A